MELMKHQLDTIARARTTNELGLFFAVGTGKTCTAINILRDIYNKHGKMLPTLIVGPLAVIYNWKKEFAKWTPKIPQSMIHVLSGSIAERIEEIEQAPRNCVLITNIDAMVSEKMLDAVLRYGPMILVIDESQMCKTHNAKRSKNMYAIARKTSYRYILTGTPILNSPMDIFMQFKILDLGKTFGDNFYIFRNKFFHDENAKWAGRQGYFPKFVPTPELFPIL